MGFPTRAEWKVDDILQSYDTAVFTAGLMVCAVREEVSRIRTVRLSRIVFASVFQTKELGILEPLQ